MSGRICPNCKKATFHVIGNAGECSNCGFSGKKPVGSGKGMKCPICGKNTLFGTKCNNPECNAKYSKGKK
jgi:hypothetical protein